MMRWVLPILMWAVLTASPAFAQNSVDEQRARDIGTQLRCVVCQNQSIEESDAELAGDMRRVVRDYIADGASDQEVIAYMRDNYGDYVLLKPPVQANTYVLWFLPALLILLSLLWFLGRARRKRPTAPAPTTLTPEDKTLLNELMRDET